MAILWPHMKPHHQEPGEVKMQKKVKRKKSQMYTQSQADINFLLALDHITFIIPASHVAFQNFATIMPNNCFLEPNTVL